jgi:outer membrane protein
MKIIAAAFALLTGLVGAAIAEDRIAYANLEVLFALLPEAKEVNRQLEAYHRELAKGLETKQAYAQQKLVEAQEAAASGVVSDEKLAAFETELRGLEREIQQTASEADQKILRKRKELMDPIAAKLETTIRAVAEAEGYTLVLNAVDGAGTSIVLYGTEERNLTSRVLEEFGISPTSNE